MRRRATAVSRGAAGLRRLWAVSPLLDRAGFVYAAVYLAWVFIHTPGTTANSVIADLAFLPLGLVVGALYVSVLRSARAAGVEKRVLWAWGLLAAESFLLWGSGAAWAYLVRDTSPDRLPGWVEALENVQLFLFLVAGLCFPGRWPDRGARWRFALDVALVGVASSIVAFHYSVEVFTTLPSMGVFSPIAARAVLTWLVFVVLALGILQNRDRTARTVMAWLLAANVFSLAGNWILTQTKDYVSGDPVDAMWFVSWATKWVAARYAWRSYRDHGAHEPQGRAPAHHGSALAHVTVALAFVQLVHVVATDQPSAPLFVYAAAVMTTLLVGRQVVLLHDNRRLFETQLAEDARFRSLVQHASDIVFVVDARGIVVYASPSVEHVLGPGAVPPGTPLDDAVALDDRLDLGGLPAAPSSLQRVTCRMRAAGGHWRDIEIVMTDLRHDAAIQGFVLNGRDVTEQNELEQRLRHAQRLDAVGQLAGGLAHDFNNILTSIRGYTDLLHHDVPEGSDAAIDLARIQQSVDRAAAVTGKLLAFSRRQSIQPTSLDLNAVLTELEPMLRQILSDRVRLRLACEPGLPAVYCDRGQLEQVVVNLITNARDALPNGGEVRLATSPVRLEGEQARLAGLADGRYVRLTVVDNGVGMPDHVRRRVFEPFFSTKGSEKGMGLGLAMVHGIVHQSGGSISVASAEGVGTTFTILVPESGRPAEAAAADAPAAPVTPATRLVLVVDDEAGVRRVVRRMLTRAGYEVHEAEGGLQALERLEDMPGGIDLLLTDMVMPGLSGLELIERFRGTWPHTPVICMTGFLGNAAEVSLQEAGVSAVVTKPFSSDALLRAISTALATVPSDQDGAGGRSERGPVVG